MLTAEHITASFLSDLKWAVAGRSAEKLRQLVSQCKSSRPDRVQPGISHTQVVPNIRLTSNEEIEVCNVSDEEVGALAKKTFCLITAVGPYALYGEPAFKTCAENGTHYLDSTPEVPWTLAMIKKYEATAKAGGACMFPQSAMESAPSDLLTWELAKEVRSKLSSQTSDVVMDLHELP